MNPVTAGGPAPEAGVTVTLDAGLVLTGDDEASLLPVVRRAAAAALAAAGRAGALLDVTLVDDAAMSRLNARYRERAETTDVLAFAGAEAGEVWARDDAPLGDVVICLDAARRQAAAAGVSPAAELMLLAVHGTLHVLGYGHETAADARRMNARTRAILDGLGGTPHRRAETD